MELDRTIPTVSHPSASKIVVKKDYYEVFTHIERVHNHVRIKSHYIYSEGVVVEFISKHHGIRDDKWTSCVNFITYRTYSLEFHYFGHKETNHSQKYFA